ncbi:MAG: DUF2332 domain-containing protein [Actinomycetota bacterium]|nr:DUF2332 domain-containing protein [Actinomycetota bacterium]
MSAGGSPAAGELGERFRSQAEQCWASGSPLTAALLDGAAGEVDRPGPLRELLLPHAGDPPGSALPLRFAGGLHRLVLERRAPALALHYPSVGGTAPVQRVWPAAREVVAAEPRLAELVRAPVQTNEVGRSAALYGVLLHLVAETGLPVRLLEVGASAGLNLRPEAYAYEVGGRVLGEPDSPVRLREPWRGRLPPLDVAVRVAERRGCDPDALDPGRTQDRVTLTSYVWADQVDRLERLRAALQVAARLPAPVEALPASAFLARELAEPVPGVLTVVWHSVVWQYLDPQERTRTTAVLRAAGARATAQAPLARVALEPVGKGGDSAAFPLAVTGWPGGGRTVLADAQGHGPPVVWRRPAARG